MQVAWIQASPGRPIQPAVHVEPSCPWIPRIQHWQRPVALSGKGVFSSPSSADC
uniref:Uncharacterized protein n=1 Tax=Arundo donax TaxID=35708 RepID=A0A0A8XTK5_ARUDO